MSIRDKIRRDIGSLNRRRWLFWGLVAIVALNLLVRLFFVNHFDPRGGMFLWAVQVIIATSAPLVAGMVLEQNLRQKQNRKQSRE